ncbi:hypothetical protein FRC00_013702, partial [Tulasnella sp. 408]
MQWNKIRRTGEHISSWIVPIVILQQDGLIEAEPFSPTITLLPHRGGGDPLRAGQAATLDGVTEQLHPEVIALYDKSIASNSRGTVQEGVMTSLEYPEQQLK